MTSDRNHRMKDQRLPRLAKLYRVSRYEMSTRRDQLGSTYENLHLLSFTSFSCKNNSDLRIQKKKTNGGRRDLEETGYNS